MHIASNPIGGLPLGDFPPLNGRMPPHQLSRQGLIRGLFDGDFVCDLFQGSNLPGRISGPVLLIPRADLVDSYPNFAFNDSLHDRVASEARGVVDVELAHEILPWVQR